MHFKALCYKNCILWKRNSCLSACEIALPVLLMGFMVLFRVLIVADKKDAKSYITLNQLNSFSPLGGVISNSYFDQSINFLPCMQDGRLLAAYIGFNGDEANIHTTVLSNT